LTEAYKVLQKHFQQFFIIIITEFLVRLLHEEHRCITVIVLHYRVMSYILEDIEKCSSKMFWTYDWCVQYHHIVRFLALVG